MVQKLNRNKSLSKKEYNKYGSGKALLQLLPQVENIFVKKLKQPERAIAIYKNVMEKTKNEKLKKVLEKKIYQLEHKKVN